MSSRYGMRSSGAGTSRVSRAVIAQRRALRQAQRTIAPIPRYTIGTRDYGELKGMDTDLGTIFSPIVSTTGTNVQILALNLLQQGAGSWERIGRKVIMKSVRIKGTALCNIVTDAANELYGSTMRMCVVYDKQPNGGAYPTFDNIFGVTSQAGAETTIYTSPPRYDTMSRYTVIKDHSFTATPACTPTTGNLQRVMFDIDMFIPLNHETTFQGTTDPMDIPSINAGALYLIARAQINDPLVSNWALTAWTRLRYTDK